MCVIKSALRSAAVVLAGREQECLGLLLRNFFFFLRESLVLLLFSPGSCGSVRFGSSGVFDPQGEIRQHNKPPLFGLEEPQRIRHESKSNLLVIMGSVCAKQSTRLAKRPQTTTEMSRTNQEENHGGPVELMSALINRLWWADVR